MTIESLARTTFLNLNDISFSNKNDMASDGTRLYVVGRTGYILRYTLGGRATRLTSPAIGDVVRVIVGQANRLIIAIQGSGVWFSDDFGDNWTQSLVDISIFLMDTNGSGQVLVGRNGSNVGFVSEDNGSTFGASTTFGSGGSNANLPQALMYHPELSLYVRLATGQRVNTSADGLAWSEINLSGQGFNDFQAQDYHDGSLYFGDSVGRVYSSADAGVNVNEILTTFYNPNIGFTAATFAVKSIISFNNRLYIGRNSSAIEVLDNGEFRPCSIGAENTIVSLSAMHVFNGDIWAASGTQMLKTQNPSSAQNFLLESCALIDPGSTLAFRDIAASSDTIYFVGNSGLFIRYNLTTGRRDTLTAGDNTSNIYGITIGDSGRLIISQATGIYISDNGGDSWTLSQAGVCARIANNGATIIVTTSTADVFRSVDNGDNFSTVSAGVGATASPSNAQSIAYHPEISSFVRLSGFNINTSPDGITWNAVTTHSGIGTWTCQAVHNGVLYLGTGGSTVSLYSSDDLGATINEVQNTFYNNDVSSGAFEYFSLFSFSGRLYSSQENSSFSFMRPSESFMRPMAVGSNTSQAGSGATSVANFAVIGGQIWGVFDNSSSIFKLLSVNNELAP